MLLVLSKVGKVAEPADGILANSRELKVVAGY